MLVARISLIAVSLVLVIGACSSSGNQPDSTKAPEHSEQQYPDVVDVTVEKTGNTFSFTVTISSPYDSPRRYADGWRVKDRNGTVYGEHTLMHDHADEQPFTRIQDGVRIPRDVSDVIVEGRDKRHGYGGKTKAVTVR